MMETFSKAGLTHLSYHRWAVEKILSAIAPLSPEELLANHKTSFETIQGTLVHIYQADAVWFDRLNGEGKIQLGQIPAPGKIQLLKEQWEELLDNFVEWGEKLPDEEWLKTREYANSQGEKFHTPVWQAVLHVVNHGTLHLGQVTAILRQSGIAPPNTDLIRFYRMESV
jgi:uncharacterized damage-inducible protein DinB